MLTRSLDTDYLVVGAGAAGMAFAVAVIDHADVHVTLVDRRHAAGGHRGRPLVAGKDGSRAVPR